MIAINPKRVDVFDRLVKIAGGDIDLVQKAIRSVSRGSDSADLNEVVQYILERKRSPVKERKVAAA